MDGSSADQRVEERGRKGGLCRFKPVRPGHARVDRWVKGGGSSTEQQRHKGREEFEADFKFFEITQTFAKLKGDQEPAECGGIGGRVPLCPGLCF